MPEGLTGFLPMVQSVVQSLAGVAVILLAFAAWRALRAGDAGNRVQLELDLQVHDVGAGAQVGELMIVLQNVGPRIQAVTNLFIEIRPSRHGASGNGKVVPASNLVTREDRPLQLPPAVRHAITWTFEIPPEERLLRVTAVISQGAWVDPDSIVTLGAKTFAQLGPSVRYLSRVFDVTSAGFRRF
jgi:hypothetical protein